ncbi:MAG: hypothetical protein JKY96_00470 [Phycisphaerales bacterium]|nr:hypothetical protein [Phycisphaerales bacterium]
MKVYQLTEFSIYLQQRPGELAGVLDAATAAGVEIFSISTTEHLDRGCVRVLGHPEDALRHVCESLVDAGIGPVVEAPVVAVSVTDRPGVVRDLAVMMADNRVNVRYCYLTPGDKAYPQAMCVFRFDEHDRAMEVIREADIPEVNQPAEEPEEVGGESAA